MRDKKGLAEGKSEAEQRIRQAAEDEVVRLRAVLRRVAAAHEGVREAWREKKRQGLASGGVGKSAVT